MYKLAISNTTDFPVRFTYKDGDRPREFSFFMLADRLPQDELTQAVRDEDRMTTEFLKSKIKGWRGQQLVLDEEGRPADFSTEAFDAMLSIIGLPAEIFAAYIKACSVTGKAKN